MLDITVIFGNNNRYNVQIEPNVVCGDLVYILPLGIGKSYLDILYCICNGKLLSSEDLNIPVMFFNVIENRVTVHFIMKPPTGEDIGLNDKFACFKYQAWVEAKYKTGTPGILETLRNTLINLIDVPVLIDLTDLETVLEPDTVTVDDSCVICSANMTALDERHSVRKCGHAFHTVCITQWLVTASVKYPMCNIDVRL